MVRVEATGRRNRRWRRMLPSKPPQVLLSPLSKIKITDWFSHPGNDDDDHGLVLLDDLSVLEHPSRKILWMPVEPFKPNKSCYVYSETPLLLEVNTPNTTLRDIVEKIIKV
ncbi:hypothetical protein ZIOFF_052676 [Zingiber officinale]|uniref:Uncharacterized protein n=1 Tax=Zingiber officinale TaxID=94328 RepID=A0A8J5FNZ6_ZINOF|nr:hypothetical protein ZIOFF_052676 [Zingiber officinale]